MNEDFVELLIEWYKRQVQKEKKDKGVVSTQINDSDDKRH